MSLFTSLFPAIATNSSANAAADSETNGSCSSGACGTSDQQARTIRPTYRLAESAEGYTVTVALPGVIKENLTVDAEDGVLNVTGKRAWQKPEGWTSIYRESIDGGYALSLAYDDAVDAGKISAQLTDGVLTLTLPKAEARKPRKIAVN